MLCRENSISCLLRIILKDSVVHASLLLIHYLQSSFQNEALFYSKLWRFFIDGKNCVLRGGDLFHITLLVCVLLMKPRALECEALESKSHLGSGPSFEQDNCVYWDCFLILEIEVIVSVLYSCGSVREVCKMSGT